MADIQALRLEVKKDGFAQLQSGNYKLTVTLNPTDLKDNAQALLMDFIKAPMGTRYMIGMAAIGDDEQPTFEPEKEPRQWADLDRCTQACILCNDPRFWDWANTTKDHARNVILSEFNITSRKELNQPRFEDHWNAYVDSYRFDMGLQAEDRS